MRNISFVEDETLLETILIDAVYIQIDYESAAEDF